VKENFLGNASLIGLGEPGPSSSESEESFDKEDVKTTNFKRSSLNMSEREKRFFAVTEHVVARYGWILLRLSRVETRAERNFHMIEGFKDGSEKTCRHDLITLGNELENTKECQMTIQTQLRDNTNDCS